MAHVVENGGLSGKLGKELVFRQWGGDTIIAKAPVKSGKSSSAAQAGTRENFHLTTVYAKAITKDPDQGLAEAYATMLKPRQTVFSRATADFMNPPVVKKISTEHYKGAVGDKIIIRAIDDFRVVSVYIQIYDSNHTLVESGEAMMGSNSIDWIYIATKKNALRSGGKITAVATDVPGNTGKMEIFFTSGN